MVDDSCNRIQSWVVGDIVQMSGADNQTSIPAYRAMRGRVVEVSRMGAIKVKWYHPAGVEVGEYKPYKDVVLGTDDMWRHPNTVERPGGAL